jgi:hypothetical protein
MSSPSNGVFTGLAVLLFGILALSSLAIDRTPPPGKAPVATPTAPVPTVVAPVPTAVPRLGADQGSLPDMQGVPAPVQRILYLRGRAETVPLDQLTSIPPEVLAVLAEYGATLTVPVAPALGAAVR